MTHISIVPPPKETASPPRRVSGVFSIAELGELNRLERDISAAKVDAERDESNSVDLAIAEKKLELFMSERDNAGAFKFKRFGREAVGFFEDRPDKPRAIETDQDGKFSLAPAARDRRLMFVNMGELDRINKEGGGHAAGDRALDATARVVEAAIVRQFGGKSAPYTLLRYRGNEFMVSFDSVSEHDFDEILRAVGEARPQVEGVDEPPPLVADGFDLAEGLDIMNQLQAELGPGEKIDGQDPFAAARELIDVMRKRADWSLDTGKFVSRVDRVQKKLREGGAVEAKTFFDNYMKKMFQGTALEELSAFEDLSKEDAERMAFEHAGKALSATADREDATRAIVATRAAEIRARQSGGSVGIESLRPPGNVPLAKVPKRTRGQLLVEAAEARAEEAAASGDPKKAELARLEAQIESARRDRGTGLLERGSHYEDLERSIKEGPETALVFVDMGFLRYFDNKGGTDVGDAALKVAADLMEKALDASGVEGRAYRYGGDEFTVQIDGGPEQVAVFRRELEALRSEAGAIPAGKRGTADGYHPTELVFNAGIAYKDLAEGVFESLKELGRYPESELADPDRVANEKAELMTIIADKGIEEQKAVNRFLMLVDAMRDRSRPPEQVDNLIAFSNKAIFAEAGGATFLRSLAESGKTEAELEKDVSGWVAERSAEARKKEGGKAELLSQLIEIHGKIAYFERALGEARHDTEAERRKYEKASAELRQAKAERQQLIDVRKALDGAGEK